jgi:hypothetical protein
MMTGKTSAKLAIIIFQYFWNLFLLFCFKFEIQLNPFDSNSEVELGANPKTSITECIQLF